MKTMVGIGAAVLLAVGGIFFFANRASDDSANTTSQNGGSEQTQNISDSGQFPSAVDIFSQSFVSNIQTSDSADPTKSGTIKMIFNSQNLWSVEIMSAEGNIKTIYAEDASYVQSPDGWTKFPTGTGGDFDVTSYGFDNDDLSDIGQSATKIGTEPCSLGTCTIWQSTNESDGSTGKVWFGPNGKPAKMLVTSGTTTTEVTYDYSSDTSISLPTDFDEFTIPDLENFDLESLSP